jgi:phage FluMu protein Com
MGRGGHFARRHRWGERTWNQTEYQVCIDRHFTEIARSGAMIDTKVKIKCPKCSQVFRERAQKLRNGFQTNCLHCNQLVTFDTSSEDRNIRRALASARDLRIALEAQPKETT